MFEIKVIGSSSDANCYFLVTSNETLIIECGVNYKKIINSLKYKISNVAGCLVSHEHQDHSKASRDLLKKGIDIYSSKGTLDALNISDHHRVHIIKAGCQFNIGGFTILPFESQHDAAEPIGFLIQHPEIGKLLFCTDTYYIRYKFSGLNYIMLECNYDKPILDKNVASGLIPLVLKQRVMKSHFSLSNVKDFLLANDLSKTVQIILMHLSDHNSDSDYFKTEIEKLTGIPVTVCNK